MPRLAFLLWKRSKTSALMPASPKIEGEGDLSICHQIPSHAVKHVVLDTGDANSFPAKTCGLPCETILPPRCNGVEAHE